MLLTPLLEEMFVFGPMYCKSPTASPSYCILLLSEKTSLPVSSLQIQRYTLNLKSWASKIRTFLYILSKPFEGWGFWSNSSRMPVKAPSPILCSRCNIWRTAASPHRGWEQWCDKHSASVQPWHDLGKVDTRDHTLFSLLAFSFNLLWGRYGRDAPQYFILWLLQ